MMRITALLLLGITALCIASPHRGYGVRPVKKVVSGNKGLGFASTVPKYQGSGLSGHGLSSGLHGAGLSSGFHGGHNAGLSSGFHGGHSSGLSSGGHGAYGKRPISSHGHHGSAGLLSSGSGYKGAAVIGHKNPVGFGSGGHRRVSGHRTY